MKKIIILTIICGTFLTFIIYKVTYHETLNMVVLGDGLATGLTAYNVKGYSFNDYFKDTFEEKSKIEEYITEFSNDLETTETLKTKLLTNYTLESTNISIQQAIAKAKIITIAIGMVELNNKNKIKSKDVDNYISNMENILKQIKIYNKKEIYVIGLYSTKKISIANTKKINESLEEICQKLQMKFINIESISQKKEYFFNDTSFYINYKGHQKIKELMLQNT